MITEMYSGPPRTQNGDSSKARHDGYSSISCPECGKPFLGRVKKGEAKFYCRKCKKTVRAVVETCD